MSSDEQAWSIISVSVYPKCVQPYVLRSRLCAKYSRSSTPNMANCLFIDLALHRGHYYAGTHEEETYVAVILTTKYSSDFLL